MTENQKCPFCRWPASFRTYFDNRHFFDVNCDRCGVFTIADLDCMTLLNEYQSNQEMRARLSALVRERSIEGLIPHSIKFSTDLYPDLPGRAGIDKEELLQRWPKTVPDRINRVLINVARKYPEAGSHFKLDRTDLSFFFATTESESFFYCKALNDLNLLHGSLTTGGFHGVITPSGWQRFEDLVGGSASPQNPVFVAMWFGGTDPEKRNEMRLLYESSIKPAVESVGYKVDRVDYIEHNDDVVDKILAMIRMAPFVVADFTGHNRGVYYEAGFARGLGRPVIHSCKESDLHEAHFDTMQLNHVLWDTHEKLKGRLHDRILGSIGPGPYSPPEASIKFNHPGNLSPLREPRN